MWSPEKLRTRRSIPDGMEQCSAIGADERRCFRRAVVDGFCRQHATMRGIAETKTRNPVWEMRPGSAEQIRKLEEIRRVHEKAWYSAGYTREEIITMLGNWPVNCGYPPYEWSVGYRV